MSRVISGYLSCQPPSKFLRTTFPGLTTGNRTRVLGCTVITRLACSSLRLLKFLPVCPFLVSKIRTTSEDIELIRQYSLNHADARGTSLKCMHLGFFIRTITTNGYYLALSILCNYLVTDAKVQYFDILHTRSLFHDLRKSLR